MKKLITKIFAISLILVGVISGLAFTNTNANAGATRVLYNNSKIGTTIKSWVTDVKNTSGTPYTYSNDKFAWHVSLNENGKQDNKKYKWKFRQQVLRENGGKEKKKELQCSATGTKWDDCSGTTADFMNKKTIVIYIKRFTTDIAGDATSLNLDIFKYNSKGTKLLNQASIPTEIIQSFKSPNIVNKITQTHMPPNNKIFAGSYYDFYVEFGSNDNYAPKGYTLPTLPIAKCPNGMSPYRSGTTTSKFFLIVGCKGELQNSGKFEVDGFGGTKINIPGANSPDGTINITKSQNTWGYSANVKNTSGITIAKVCNGLDGVLLDGCMDSKTISSADIKRGSKIFIQDFKLYKNNDPKSISDVEVYDNNSDRTLDSSIFSGITTSSLGQSATDTIVQSANGNSAKFELTAGQFAGLRNLEIRIEPFDEQNLYGILDFNLAVYGTPLIMGVESSSQYSEQTCQNNFDSIGNSKCNIESNIPQNQELIERFKVNEYNGSVQSFPQWIGGSVIDGISPVKDNDLSVNGIYTTYKVANTNGFSDLTSKQGTLYFPTNPGSIINIKINPYATDIDTELENLNIISPVGRQKIGFFNSTSSTIPLQTFQIANLNSSSSGFINTRDNNHQVQSAYLTVPKGVNINGIVNGNAIVDGKLNNSGEFKITLKTADLGDYKIPDLEYSYAISSYDTNSLLKVSSNGKKLQTTSFDGIDRKWEVGSKSIYSNSFSPTYKQRGIKKITLSVLAGDKIIAKKTFKIPKYKPILKLTKVKVIGRKIRATVNLSKNYKINGKKMIIIGNKKFNIKHNKAKVLLPIKSKIRLKFKGNKHLKSIKKIIKLAS